MALCYGEDWSRNVERRRREIMNRWREADDATLIEGSDSEKGSNLELIE